MTDRSCPLRMAARNFMSKENKSHRTSLVQKLQDIQNLATEALCELGDGVRKPRRAEHKVHNSASGPTSLPRHILKLRETGYFKQPKTVKEVHSKLKPTYDCEFDRVVMALLRVQRRK